MDRAIRNTAVGRVIRKRRAWIASAARAGFGAQALVYGTVGVLAGQVALGIGGRTVDTPGAIAEIGGGTVGVFLLLPMAVGFFGYGIWRTVQAIADTEDKGRGFMGIAVRTGYFIAGLINGWLGVIAARILIGDRPANAETAKTWTAELLGWSYGQELVVVAGIGVVIFGLAQYHRAYSKEYREHLDVGQMDSRERTLAAGVSTVGLVARGTIYLLAGIFLVSAALQADPSEAEDPAGVLRAVSGEAHGALLLGALALGMLAYAGYAAFEAAYRRTLE